MVLMWTKLEITTKDNDGGDDLSESNGIAADDATTAAAADGVDVDVDVDVDAAADDDAALRWQPIPAFLW